MKEQQMIVWKYLNIEMVTLECLEEGVTKRVSRSVWACAAAIFCLTK